MARSSLYPVLLIDDEVQFLQGAAIILRGAGFEVVTCTSAEEAPSLLTERQFGVVVLDILMPRMKGTELLPDILKKSPSSRVIMMTAVSDIETAIACMRQGAFDYLIKPVEKERLITTVRRALDIVELSNENRLLRDRLLGDRLECPEHFERIVTRDRRMVSIFKYIEAIAQTNRPVLIQGETGTGKELIAGAIHDASGRKGAFVSVNISGLNDALFSDTLFGHERGAFTGADSRREGLVAKASGGTLFLDEIGDLAMESQVKLLRLLEEKTYYPAGSDNQRITDARFIVATNKNLAEIQKKGIFRSDLYFRLEAHKVDLPPLRERKTDIPLLVDTFVEEAAEQLHKEPPRVPEALYSLLQHYSFPGNLRELRNMIADAVSVATGDALEAAYFTERLNSNRRLWTEIPPPDTMTKENIALWPELPSLKDAERMLIDEALRRSKGNQTLAARILGMTRSALNKRLIRAKGGDEDQ